MPAKTPRQRLAYIEGKVEEMLKRKGVWDISLSPLKSANMTVEERLSRIEDILKEYFNIPKLEEVRRQWRQK